MMENKLHNIILKSENEKENIKENLKINMV